MSPATLATELLEIRGLALQQRSELRRREEEIRTLQAEMSALLLRQKRITIELHAMIHDVAGPLTEALFVAEDLEEASLPAAGKRLERVVRQIEDELGELRVLLGRGGRRRAVSLDLHELAEEATSTLADDGVLIENRITPGLRALGQPEATRRILWNLVRNATAVARVVRISAEIIGSSALIRVEDDGPGVPLADRERIFHLWEGDRNGVGLASSRMLATAQGGTLVVSRSDELGGAAFELRLPAAEGLGTRDQ